MSMHNICLYKQVDKITGVILRLLDCMLIGICAIIRSNTVVIWIPLSLKPAGNKCLLQAAWIGKII